MNLDNKFGKVFYTQYAIYAKSHYIHYSYTYYCM